MIKQSLVDKILKLCIGIGLLLTIVNFIANRALWLDEAALAVNIKAKSASELLQPLDENQVAPIGFLLTEKLISKAFGYPDWSFRVFPLICFVLALYFTYRVSVRISMQHTVALLATALFSSAYYVMYYAVEVKQYIVDTLVYSLVTLLTLNLIDIQSTKKLALYAMVGVIAIWFSNVSIIILFTSGLFILYRTYGNKQSFLPPSLVIGSWVASFVIYFLLFIYAHPTRDFMIEYWEYQGAFISQNIFSVGFISGLLLKFESYFELLGFKQLSLLLVPFFIAGILAMKKNRSGVLFLLLAPLVVHLLLSFLHLYPFDLRLILYLTPALLYLIAEGTNYFVAKFFLPRRHYLLILMCVPVLLNFTLISMRGFPFKNEETKEAIQYINDHLSSDDKIYVYDGARLAFVFYQEHFDKLAEISEETVFYAEQARDDWSKHDGGIQSLNGDIWLLFSHTYWLRNQANLTEKEYIIEVFKRNGFITMDEIAFEGTSVHKVSKTLEIK